MYQITIICFLIVFSVCVSKVQGGKENHLQKDSLSTSSHKLETAKTIGVSKDDDFKVLSGSSEKSPTKSLHTTAEMGNPSSAHIKRSKETPAKKAPVVADHSSKSVSKKRHKTTPRLTTAQSTVKETTTEPTTTETTIETTTEELTTIETTMIEELTTIETTTIEETTTTETTTTETPTVEDTTKESVNTQKASVKPTPRLKSSPIGDSSALNSSTKSWEKYISKTTPSSKEHSMIDMTTKMALKSDENLLMKSAEKATSNGQYQRTTTPSTYVNTRPPKNSVHDTPNQNGVKVKKTYTSLPNTGSTEAWTTPNTSVDVKVDIDIKLRSSLTSSTEGNVSVKYFSTQAPSSIPTTPKNREKRHQKKKKVLAGVILVVLISLSAAFAILFVLVPAKTDVRTRKYHRRPDQVELIAPGRRSRPRFYDASMYIGN